MSVRNAALWSIAGQYFLFILQFAASVIISRYFLAPAEVGLFSLALSAAMLVSLLQDFGITRYVSGMPALDHRQIQACFSVSLLMGFGIALFILAMSYPASLFYRDARLMPMLVLVAASFLFVPLNVVPIALLQRQMKFREVSFVNGGGAVANVAVALTLAFYGFSAFSLAWAAIAQQAVRAAIAHSLNREQLSFRPSLADAMPILRFGSGTTVLNVSGSLGSRTPELILGRLLGLTAVGLYSRAASLSDQLRTLVSGAVGAVFYTAFAKLRDEGEALGPPYQRVVACYTAVTWPAMAMLAAAAEPLVLALYGERWIGVAPILRWVALSQIMFVALPLHTELPILFGRMGSLIRRNVLDTSVSVGFLFFGAYHSLEGAALSRLAYAVVWYGIYFVFIRGIVRFSSRKLLLIYIQSGAATVATVAPVLLLRASGYPLTAVTMFGAVALGGGLWLGSLFTIAHPARDEIVAVARGFLPKKPA